MYLHGGGGLDLARAAELFQLAAEQGLARAQIVWPISIKVAREAPEHDTAAISWLQKAAEQGRAEAQNKLESAIHRTSHRGQRGTCGRVAC